MNKNIEERLLMLSWIIKELKVEGVKVEIRQLTFESDELGTEEVDLNFLDDYFHRDLS